MGVICLPEGKLDQLHPEMKVLPQQFLNVWNPSDKTLLTVY